MYVCMYVCIYVCGYIYMHVRHIGLDSEQLSALYSTICDIVKDKYDREARVKKISSPIVDSNGSKGIVASSDSDKAGENHNFFSMLILK